MCVCVFGVFSIDLFFQLLFCISRCRHPLCLPKNNLFLSMPKTDCAKYKFPTKGIFLLLTLRPIYDSRNDEPTKKKRLFFARLFLTRFSVWELFESVSVCVCVCVIPHWRIPYFNELVRCLSWVYTNTFVLDSCTYSSEQTYMPHIFVQLKVWIWEPHHVYMCGIGFVHNCIVMWAHTLLCTIFASGAKVTRFDCVQRTVTPIWKWNQSLNFLRINLSITGERWLVYDSWLDHIVTLSI